MKCPLLSEHLIISDSVEIAAQAACILCEPKKYLSVVDGPRLTRPDGESEVIRRNNVAARIRASRIIMAGLSDSSAQSFDRHFPAKKVVRVNSEEDVLTHLARSSNLSMPRLPWGRKNIGVGLLKALRSNALIEIREDLDTEDHLESKSGHLVVCEAGEDISEIIAATYAYALGAGIKIIPQVDESVSGRLLERFYSLYESVGDTMSRSDYLHDIQDEMRSLCGDIDTSVNTSLTIISKELPFGLAFPEVPSTHLFSYPDLGLAVANGFAAEQARTRGTNVALLIDPEQTEAPEIQTISQSLAKRRAFVRGYSGKGASVRAVSDAVELFPYDLLVFATHCGDATGYRWTYEFRDSEGYDRRLVVDIALGVGRTRQKDILDVVQYMRFHELDGVDWMDPEKEKKVHIGNAIRDFTDRYRSDDSFKPAKKEQIDRVLGSAALRMYDNNYLAIQTSLANNGTPIVINNACGSWHRLASDFVFAGCRAYIGTMFPITTSEAHDVLNNVFGKQWGKVLPHALWAAQNSVYRDSVRRPYVATGVYCARIRITPENVPLTLVERLLDGQSAATRMQQRAKSEANDFLERRASDALEFYQREIAGIVKRYGLTN